MRKIEIGELEIGDVIKLNNDIMLITTDTVESIWSIIGSTNKRRLFKSCKPLSRLGAVDNLYLVGKLLVNGENNEFSIKLTEEH